MLPTRSARLAATLLLALLLGWVVRSQRMRHPPAAGAPPQEPPATRIDKSPKNSFPDE